MNRRFRCAKLERWKSGRDALFWPPSRGVLSGPVRPTYPAHGALFAGRQTLISRPGPSGDTTDAPRCGDRFGCYMWHSIIFFLDGKYITTYNVDFYVALFLCGRKTSKNTYAKHCSRHCQAVGALEQTKKLQL